MVKLNALFNKKTNAFVCFCTEVDSIIRDNFHIHIVDIEQYQINNAKWKGDYINGHLIIDDSDDKQQAAITKRNVSFFGQYNIHELMWILIKQIKETCSATRTHQTQQFGNMIALYDSVNAQYLSDMMKIYNESNKTG